jgi:MFS family permease
MTGTAQRRNGLIRGFGCASSTVRLLVLTQLAFNVGFFMVLPYLSVHLSSDLGQATAVVGVVLGLRTVSQQGMFFVGGAIADRIGTKPATLTGCAVRVVGLLTLGLSPSVAGVAVGAALTGFAGALFSPAVEAALARASAADIGQEAASTARLDAFALFNAFGQIGAFTGPLLGALLLRVDFAVVSVTGAAVFVVIGLAHLKWLPNERPAAADRAILHGLNVIARNRAFLCFATVMAVQLVAYNQLYLLLPLELDRGWGDQEPLGILLAVSSVAIVIGQFRVAAWTSRRHVRKALSVGLMVTALGALAAALAAAVGGRLAVIAGTAAFVLLLALGQMIIGPAARAAIPTFANERHLGSYYGMYASIGGILVLPASAGLGAIVDAVPDTAAGRAAPWLATAAVLFLAAGLVTRAAGGRRP